MRILFFVLFIYSCSFQLKSEVALEKKFKGEVHQLTAYLFDGNIESLWETFSPKMKTAFKTKEAFESVQKSIVGQLGEEVTVVEELFYPSEVVYSNYYRKSKYANTKDAVIVMHWTLDQNNEVVGLSVSGEKKPAESSYLNYKSKNKYYFPLKKDAYILWGGRRIEQNYHVAAPNQRFAYDIGVVKNGRVFVNRGAENTDFHCFGVPVYSPGKGKVIDSKDGVLDSKPGEMNKKELMGNYVVIEHPGNEYSFFAHFKRGSVKVKVGQSVTKETLLGECGNSGHSSEPHVHYHLQDHKEFEKGKGLPIFFSDIVVNEKEHSIYEPTINQTIHRK